MKCPRCGADNADRAERCYLCELPLAGGGTAGEPPAPEERIQPQYPPQGTQAGMVPPGQQAAPPPGAQGMGYQLPPGAYPGGIQPPPPPSKGPNTVKIIIGVLVILLVVIIAVGAFFLLRGKTYSVEVPTPPGYKEASESDFDSARESIESGSGDAALDYLFINNAGDSFVFVAHQDFFLEELPPEDPEEAERYYNENRDEILSDMNLGFETSGVPGSLDVDEYNTMSLGSGDTALHFAISMNIQDLTMTMDAFIAVKGKTMFMVIVQGFGTANLRDTLDHIAQNITFSD
ncbi:MAG: hypothetical protein JW854_01515 [Actinobacteria bacterium]|nr:hypothetical protein [Actinomycetota bacterium]